jgi:hypothetical protein
MRYITFATSWLGGFAAIPLAAASPFLSLRLLSFKK